MNISERALIKRINRKLAHEGEVLRTARSYTVELGWYYVIDGVTSFPVTCQCDLEYLALELGVLHAGEALEKEVPMGFKGTTLKKAPATNHQAFHC
ncbi:hypothetical protein [Pseudomonas fluorescens]|uniref:Uncharacterized protein n=1 Tax=Pseudomonas fluorescens TaxID=294 RepID=A0A5E7U404_PSEFL|nr:hypothetical protein [Pseudomonas fluorescens]VVQ05149.1 hypothetical protein PS928_02973 [Pseudomonas fluorescens]